MKEVRKENWKVWKSWSKKEKRDEKKRGRRGRWKKKKGGKWKRVGIEKRSEMGILTHMKGKKINVDKEIHEHAFVQKLKKQNANAHISTPVTCFL
jgi:hypothetical protein